MIESFNDIDVKDADTLADVERRWAWVEVNLSAIRHNILQAKNIVGPKVKVLAVVKANAYGHGAIPVAKTAIKAGAAYLGVASVDEAIELRKADINAPILILSQPPESSIPLLIKYNIQPSIYTPDFAIRYAEYADSNSVPAPYHMAINTGMNRIGVRYNKVVEFMRQVGFHRALKLSGTFTHFATADCDQSIDFRMQLSNFTEAISQIKSAGFDPGIVHCANSAATLRYPQTHFDMVRFGYSMYGYHTCPQTKNTCELQPAMSVHARITDERVLGVGEGVSYEMNYRARGAVKVCTIPIGYADGLRRCLSGKIDVLYKGYRFPQIGNICMDQCMFEIDMNSGFAQEHFNAQIGEEVVLLGRYNKGYIPIEEIADLCYSNGYEVACGFSRRMPILYV